MRKLKIGMLSRHNAYDRNAFSGTVFYMRRALETLGDVHVLGGHRPPPATIWNKMKRRLHRPGDFDLVPADQLDMDVVIAPVATAEILHCADRLTAPVIAVTDATPGFLAEFYGRHVTQTFRDNEARMLGQVAAIVYSSQFMAHKAQAEFADLPADKVHVAPFGVNLDHLPSAPPQKPPLDPLQLLFIGQDWERKGGAIALETLDALRTRGINAHLTTIGATVPEAEQHSAVTVLGYLNKNQPADMARFSAALSAAHVLLFPTRADCTPMVIAEANAYGCPVVVSDTGGIGSLLENGVNGQMLPLAAGASEYCDVLMQLCTDTSAYTALSQSSFDHCHLHLTWDAWAKRMHAVIDDVLKAPNMRRA